MVFVGARTQHSEWPILLTLCVCFPVAVPSLFHCKTFVENEFSCNDNEDFGMAWRMGCHDAHKFPTENYNIVYMYVIFYMIPVYVCMLCLLYCFVSFNDELSGVQNSVGTEWLALVFDVTVCLAQPNPI